MQTHIKNTKSIEIYTNYSNKLSYTNHIHALATEQIKPKVVTKRKQQVKIVNNNKKQINEQPLQHVNRLFKNIHDKKYKSTLDNKMPECYLNGKKILKDRVKKNPQEQFMKTEHDRELRSQQSRVTNCKNITQRKKDNTDPIVNPTYFMREANRTETVTIEGYKNTVLQKNRPVSAAPFSTNPRKNIELQFNSTSKNDDLKDMPTSKNFSNVPNMNQNRKNGTKSSSFYHNKRENEVEMIGDLPQCTFKSILSHIINNKLYKDVDIKVLYVRLCHKYGEERVDDIWQVLMDELEN